MTEHGIIFSAQRVRAILDGRKTMTRQVLPNGRRPGPMMPDTDDIRYDAESGEFYCERGRWHAKARWRPGDRLWVREAFTIQWGGVIYDAAGGQCDKMDDEILYAADYTNQKTHRWTPPKRMRSPALSRITLLVTAVRVERLQDISELDAVAEGVGLSPADRHGDHDHRWIKGRCRDCRHWDTNVPPNGSRRTSCPFKYKPEQPDPPYGDAGQGCSHSFELSDGVGETARFRYRHYWDSLHGLDAWNDNPWVSVTTFERIEK